MFYRNSPLSRVDTVPLYISHNFPPSGDRPGAECLQTRRYCMPPEVPKRVQGTVLPLGLSFPACFWSQIFEAHQFFHICRVLATSHRTPEAPSKKIWRISTRIEWRGFAIFPPLFFEGFRCSLRDCNHPANIGKFVRFKYLGPETVRKRCPRDEIRNFVWRISRATSEWRATALAHCASTLRAQATRCCSLICNMDAHATKSLNFTFLNILDYQLTHDFDS